MTVYYLNRDLRLLEERVLVPPSTTEATEPMTEVPDMNEAERIWKLLVSAAQS